MKKQVVFIHGGTAFSKYSAFIEYLKTTPVRNSLEDDIPRRWTTDLRDDLGDAYEVYMPSMPNKQNAKYNEWKIWFERHFEFLQDGAILIGHSQGGYFLAKYLIENNMPMKVKALYLVAAPFEPDDFDGEDGGGFNFDTTKLDEIAQKVKKIFIFHSKDDPVVPFAHAEKYKKALRNAELVSFENHGHFLMEEFPEIIDSISSLD